MSRLFVRIYVGVLIAMVVAMGTGGLLVRHSLARSVERHIEQLVSVPAALLAGELDTIDDPAQRQEAVQALGERLTFDVALLDAGAVDLDGERARRLADGQVVADGNWGSHRLYAPLEGGEVLCFGPMPRVQLITEGRGFVLMGSVVLALGIAVLALLTPLRRQITDLDDAARSFGDGQLDARARVRREDAAGDLARTFNGMANRIEGHVTSQRELLRAVSHELSTPIARVRFGVELLADVEDGAEREARAQAIQGDLAELEELVQELLTHGRLDGGGEELELEDVGLDELINMEIELLRILREDIEITAAGTGERVVKAHRRLLRRALSNLLRNAARHAVGAVQITVVPGEPLELHVDDDGPGIPAADRERIFEPFVRLDAARSRRKGGTGLGLAIVQRIAQAHGGTVVAQESPLGGARFVFTLPQSIS